ncbi:phosphate ABC transporter substrate-binding protein [Rugosibacter aromaticivorans]|uniref:Phosphate-binding protein PstS n=1 Tax=Rugosibacter aromaticivorans TaxID=1565605 RepID=A0A0C5J080_9PROT|nr:phosphate ABC transporter substrate-binding protein PstS [Rugosibacter aromaticivorans]AJP48462.1 phosphate ABC transporter substrate-binding protein [Rugosibacter aromaticivorans]TBR15330.1 MAG: phosphate ABC transporter substrate-binding protein PstS [Rugosibacter sp.]
MIPKQIKRFVIPVAAVACAINFTQVQAAEITGAGATFPAPIYGKWAEAYHKATGNKINYQSIGSGGGIKQINAKTVDFGASDMPLKPDVLDKDGLMQFPAVIGGEVLVVNIVGVKPGEMRLTPAVLADIYLGNITKWNDKAIVALNPKLSLPDQAIAVVRRADGSGTTFIFTNYLSKVSPEWKQKVGEGTAVQWPLGLGGKGNEGVAAFVQRIPGAIGYVEYAYSKQNNMTYTLLQNAEGNYPIPDDTTFKAAAANADWTKSAFYEILTNEPGKDAWPITGATFILMHKVQDKPVQAAEVLKFFDWSYKNGGKMAHDLDYVPLPESLVNLIRSAWKNTIKDASGKPVYK